VSIERIEFDCALEHYHTREAESDYGDLECTVSVDTTEGYINLELPEKLKQPPIHVMLTYDRTKGRARLSIERITKGGDDTEAVLHIDLDTMKVTRFDLQPHINSREKVI
jgi:hypothetical protein